MTGLDSGRALDEVLVLRRDALLEGFAVAFGHRHALLGQSRQRLLLDRKPMGTRVGRGLLGGIDGLEHDPPTILASKFFETAKFYSLTQHNFSPLAIYFSDVTYNRMDPKLREGFLVYGAPGRRAQISPKARGVAAAPIKRRHSVITGFGNVLILRPARSSGVFTGFLASTLREPKL
ncbi:hypothetical protein ACVIJW_002850 [Bradyrhizobium barranii subsp. barranii]